MYDVADEDVARQKKIYYFQVYIHCFAIARVCVAARLNVYNTKQVTQDARLIIYSTVNAAQHRLSVLPKRVREVQSKFMLLSKKLPAGANIKGVASAEVARPWLVARALRDNLEGFRLSAAQR